MRAVTSLRKILAAAGVAVLLLMFIVASSTASAIEGAAVAPVCNRQISNETMMDDKGEEESSETEYVYKFEPPDVEWCRRRPTWRHVRNENGDGDDNSVDIRDKCQKVLGYEPDLEALTEEESYVLSSHYDPLDDHDYDKDAYYELPILERPLLKMVATCMDTALAKSEHHRSNGINTGTLKTPSIKTEYRRDTDGLVVMAIVENALCEEEAEAILALTICAKKFIPNVFERRTFDQTDEGGGNDTTFLAGFLQLLAPGVAARTFLNAQLVWETVGWADDEDDTYKPVDLQYYDKETEDESTPPSTLYSTRWWPEPMSDCGIRTSEHLSYDRWGVLGYHEDAGSEYTVLAALSDPDSYEGGEFSICPYSEYVNGIYEFGESGRRFSDNWETVTGRNCPERISVKPDRLSAIVFLGIFNHGVEDIKSPGRVMFTNELWRYGSVPATKLRPGIKDFVLGLSGDDDDDDYYDDDDDDDDYYDHDDHDEEEEDKGEDEEIIIEEDDMDEDDMNKYNDYDDKHVEERIQ